MTITLNRSRRAARLLGCLLILTSFAWRPAHPEDWPAWGRDPGNQRHSPLTQINKDNVKTLVPAWQYKMTKRGVPSRPAQSTPLMVDGVLYLSFPYYRVVALEPETGSEIWEYTAPGDWNSEEHQKHWTGGSMRGLAYWDGDEVTPPQIVFGTEEGHLISLDAKTGIPNERFGEEGFRQLEDAGRDERLPEHALRHRVGSCHLRESGLHARAQRRRDRVEGTGRRHTRLGSADRRARLDVQHGASPRPDRPRHLAGRLLAQGQWRQHVELLQRRRRTRHSLHAARIRAQRLLRVRPSWRQPLLPTRSWRSTPGRESSSGTSRRCITTSGTWTCRCRRSCSTWSATAKRYPLSVS